MNALLIGLRLALTGGRSAQLRALMTAVGVGAGVVVLLVAASVPNMIAARDAREAAQGSGLESVGKPADDTLLLRDAYTEYRDEAIDGSDLRPDGPRAPVPPGVERLPAPGEMFVSPALADRLAGEEGRLLRERLDARVVGVIGDEGLGGPQSLSFYRGAADIRPQDGYRISAFGYPYEREALPVYFVFIVVVGVVVMLLPVAIFVATAVRFGGDERDRRLAAMRLIGADRLMTARVAAGEALAGALGGLVLGTLAFLALRPFVESISLQDISVFAADVQPSPGLALLIVVGVPLSAVLLSVAAMRRVAIEPLGVIRRGTRSRRRLWWRLAPILVGGALLAEVGGAVAGIDDVDELRLSAGLILVLVGLTALLPWIVEAVVRRFGGGSVAWQLAVRRLQLDSATAARVVSGVAVAVAGAIALQSVLAAGQRASTFSTGGDLSRAQMAVGIGASKAATVERVRADLNATPGVTRALVTLSTSRARVGECDALREYGRIGQCAAGDVFVAGRPKLRGLELPANARRIAARVTPQGYKDASVLATPGTLPIEVRPGFHAVEALISIDPAQPDAVEYVRNTMARFIPEGYVNEIGETTELDAYRTVSRGVYAAAVIVLLLVGASLLIGGLEQLRERRPVLAAMSAFGTPRSVMARSVVWQAAIPVFLGIAVAIAIGLSLAALLLRIGNQSLDIDWAAVAIMGGAGALVILLVTALTLPALIRLSRPVGLRAE